ncbi:MAG TPA: DUF3455 domain-containing protein [Polyangiaceae bacterium]|nr:DUF3455 domain-containing protein [Polyangiaceae bacterium]
MSNHRLSLLSLSCLAALLFAACAADDSDAASADAIADSSEALKQRLPTIPDALAVPAGNKLSFTLFGDGVQIYDCKTNADGNPAWTFRAPEADLFSGKHLAGIHYAGPTWEALDGSTVVGTRVAGVTVDASAIQWLLLSAVSPDQHGRMAGVTYIQRLETVGGMAPTTSCELGAVAEVDYTALYAFYKAHGCGTH